MKKLNNRGLTVVEVIICFSITAVIVVSLFKIIANYNDKQYIESNKNQVITYKNIVTKTIQSDIINNKGISTLNSNINDNYDSMYNSGIISIGFNYTNGKSASIEINVKEGQEYIYFVNSNNEKEKFPLSDIGNGVVFNEPKIDYDLDNALLNIYVGINHPDLGDKYSVLDMVLPLTSKWNKVY